MNSDLSKNAPASPVSTVAVIGTGVMGAPIARNLAKKGFRVRAWNRTAGKAEALAAESDVLACETVAEAVEGADVVITMLKDGPAILAALRPAAAVLPNGALWLQMSTVGPDALVELLDFSTEHGLVFYDAPVQGTKKPAEAGQLIVLAAGPAAQRDQAQPIFDAIGQRTVWTSDQPGASSKLKLALNNFVFAVTHGVAESLAIAVGLGVDPNLVVDVVTGGATDSDYFQAKSSAILAEQYTPSFTVDNAAKDSRLIVEAAQRAGVKVDGAEAGLARFERASEAGHGDKDMAASFFAS